MKSLWRRWYFDVLSFRGKVLCLDVFQVGKSAGVAVRWAQRGEGSGGVESELEGFHAEHGNIAAVGLHAAQPYRGYNVNLESENSRMDLDYALPETGWFPFDNSIPGVAMTVEFPAIRSAVHAQISIGTRGWTFDGSGCRGLFSWGLPARLPPCQAIEWGRAYFEAYTLAYFYVKHYPEGYSRSLVLRSRPAPGPQPSAGLGIEDHQFTISTGRGLGELFIVHKAFTLEGIRWASLYDGPAGTDPLLGALTDRNRFRKYACNPYIRRVFLETTLRIMDETAHGIGIHEQIVWHWPYFMQTDEASDVDL